MSCLWELLEYGERELAAAGVPEAGLNAWYLLEFAAGVSRTAYLCDKKRPVSAEAEARYRALIRKRAGRVPLEYITGERAFMGLSFAVNEHVLIPRQDTEVLVEQVIKDAGGKRDLKILDMCTGSGCIIISLAHFLDLREGVGADISDEALKVAAANAEKNRAEVTLIKSDMFSGVSGTYDILVSNPPYIRSDIIMTLEPEVKDFEPLGALDGKEDGLYFYRILAKEARRFLKPEGRIYLEIGYDQGDEVSKLLMNHGFEDIRIFSDLAGLPRVAAGRNGR